MSYSLQYDEHNKLIVTDLVCDCPCEHNKPLVDIYVGSGILDNLPSYIRGRGLGTHCVLVADNNTYEIAGKRAETLLREAGFDVILCVMCREGEMEPDERACGEVLLPDLMGAAVIACADVKH